MSDARFEIVTTATDQHHARFRASNGRIVWTTETYRRKRAAKNAIEVITGAFVTMVRGDIGVHCAGAETGFAEVRYIDEREATA